MDKVDELLLNLPPRMKKYRISITVLYLLCSNYGLCKTLECFTRSDGKGNEIYGFNFIFLFKSGEYEVTNYKQSNFVQFYYFDKELIVSFEELIDILTEFSISFSITNANDHPMIKMMIDKIKSEASISGKI